MAKKNYMDDANHHAGKVKYYYDQGGASGHPPVHLEGRGDPVDEALRAG
jgi:hypothetical protein